MSAQEQGAVTLKDVLDRFSDEVHDGVRWRMYEALVQREEAIGDMLRLAGAQFGLYPQIVAEVLASAGLGMPMSVAEREFVRSRFTELMEQIAAAQRGEGPMPNP